MSRKGRNRKSENHQEKKEGFFDTEKHEEIEEQNAGTVEEASFVDVEKSGDAPEYGPARPHDGGQGGLPLAGY